MTPQPLATFRWTGTQNASTSEQVDAAGTVVRTNLVSNPRGVTTTGYSSPGNGYTVSAQTENGRTFVRGLAATASAAGTWNAIAYNSPGVTVASGLAYAITVALRVTAAGTNNPNLLIRFNNASGGIVGSYQVIAVPDAAGDWATVAAVLTAPVDATVVQVIASNGSSNAGNARAVGDAIDMTELLVEASDTLGDYFDGDTAPIIAGA